jgi:hypothetical protein
MKWEYKIVHVNASKWTSTGLPGDLGEKFDRWGDEGWELVRFEPLLQPSWLGYGTRTAAFVAIFRRPKT